MKVQLPHAHLVLNLFKHLEKNTIFKQQFFNAKKQKLKTCTF